MTNFVHGVMRRLFSDQQLKEWATEFSVNFFLSRSASRSYWLMVRARVLTF